MFDDEGTLGLSHDEDASRLSIATFTSRFTINKTKVTGELTWNRTDAPPLQISCDALTLRIEGRVRYTVTQPFVDSGIADIRISGSRRSITNPYYGNVSLIFLPPR